MNFRNCFKLWLLCLLLAGPGALAQEGRVAVGSKEFAESQLLGEILATLIETRTHLAVERRFGLAGTSVCFEALRTGSIDMYVEYTGTGLQAILKEPVLTDPEIVYQRVKQAFAAQYDLQWLSPLGFNNTYVLAMRADQAERLKIGTISDLARRQGRIGEQLRFGFSHPFLEREDGYPGLARAYPFRVPKEQLQGLQHGLAYSALKRGQVDIIDAYSTDGKLMKYRLKLLQDDRRYFPPYYAAPLVRQDTLQKYPALLLVLEQLAGRISDARMQQLNFEIEEKGRSFRDVAVDFLNETGLTRIREAKAPAASAALPVFLWQQRARIGQLTLEHLKLTGIAVGLASLIGIPLGILISRYPASAQLVLAGAGVLQTIPSIALLLFMLPLFGIGALPAVVALVLYALLPIVRNTYTGLKEVPADLLEAGRGLGLTPGQILRRVELPLAAKVMMAGVRTATVITIGTATLAAFIGGGGLGEPIVTGLQLLNIPMVLSGAVPAAGLALIVDALLALVEKGVSPRLRGSAD